MFSFYSMQDQNCRNFYQFLPINIIDVLKFLITNDGATMTLRIMRNDFQWSIYIYTPRSQSTIDLLAEALYDYY
jgi:hypothetical protein